MTDVRARSPWIAATLSAVASPGLGQLYNGRLLKTALVVFGLPLAYAAALVFVLRAGGGPGWLLFVYGLVMAGWAVTVVDAFRDARRLGAAPRSWFSRWYVLVGVGLLTVLVLVPFWTVALLRTTVQAFKLPTGSMQRTLLVGDHVLADVTAYGFRLPFAETPSFGLRPAHRGDIAVFLYPANPRQHFLMRVIGLPGETVEIRGGRVHVNDVVLDEPYVTFVVADDEAYARDWGPETVPPGQYFVLGDNRDNSKDSRYWGFLPADHLVGRIAVVYFSIEQSRSEVNGRAGSGRIRWDRIGHVPR